MFRRLCNPLLSNSFFLFGGRGVGKSTLVSQILSKKEVLAVDLLDPVEEERFSLHPNEFKERILKNRKNLDWVFVDEIQRCPKLLNLIHQMIESNKIKFAMTGSSARKLRRGAANLLAGRAFLNYLYPLTHQELGAEFKLEEILKFGALPKLFALTTPPEKIKYLQSYATTFVQEEIKAEQIVRKLDPFRRFLEVAAQHNGTILNYANIAEDVGADLKTVQSYYQILEDTLIGFFLEPFHTSARKSVGQKPKFYFFDIGVQRALAKQLTVDLSESTSVFGDLFEAFIICEVQRLNAYLEKDFTLSFLRTKDDVEIDLIVTRPGKKKLLIEIKSGKEVKTEKMKRFLNLANDIPNSDILCLYRGEHARKIEKVDVLPWREGITRIFE